MFQQFDLSMSGGPHAGLTNLPLQRPPPERPPEEPRPQDPPPPKLRQRLPNKRKLAEIRGISTIDGEKVGVVVFVGALQPTIVGWEELKRTYLRECLLFYERHLMAKPATAEEISAINGSGDDA